MNMTEILVALDGMQRFEAINFARTLQNQVTGFKVNDLLLDRGTAIINDLSPYGPVMADCKLFDIPFTIANCVSKLAKEGVSYITVHASAGVKGLQAAIDAAEDRCKIVAVTTLSSMSQDEIDSVYFTSPCIRFCKIFEKVKGLYGVVCAASDLNEFKGLKTFVPGIRINAGVLKDDDQQRTVVTKVQADYLIVGRPVTRHQDPLKAIQEIKDLYEPK
jgi:orotidine-5'-phosphate decarboxylase